MARTLPDHALQRTANVRSESDSRDSQRDRQGGGGVESGQSADEITCQCSRPSRRVRFLLFQSRRGAGSATDRHYVMSLAEHPTSPVPLEYSGVRRGQRLRAPRVSLAVLAVIANHAVFFFGVFLDRFGGWIDQFGAVLCRATYALAGPLVIAACLYSAIRRHVLPRRIWDFYGPSLALIGYLLAHVLIRERPWWLPVIPGW